MRMTRTLLICAGSIVLLGAAPSDAADARQPLQQTLASAFSLAGITQFYRLCVVDLQIVEPAVVKIPVGCEVIDCCPGCPGGGEIEWRIALGGDPVRSAVLSFDGMSSQAARRLKIEGKARWLNERELRIEPGLTTIRGFPYDRHGRAPVATPRLELDSASAQLRDVNSSRDVELSVNQFLAGVPVNEYYLRYRFIWCPPLSPQDRIRLTDNTSGDNAAILLDARRNTGCRNDEQWRAVTEVGVGSVLSNGTCNSEVAVFSDDDAMQLFPNVTAWTNALGDLFTANLTQAVWQPPISVWVTIASGTAAAPADVALASQLFNTNHAGVTFTSTVTNLVGNNAATTTIGVPSCTAASIAALRGSGFFTANRLNVYYVNFAGTGYTCVADMNIVVIGTGARPESLAHEIGHTFSLDHVNFVDYDADGVSDFPVTNVMWAGGTGRTTFSEGQDFRMNLNPTSMLNVNGFRTLPLTRTCADPTISSTCPWVALDIIPN